MTVSVSELTRQVKDCLEGNFPAVTVAGELSNVVQAASGHVYMNLKDDRAQIRGVMWKSNAGRLKFDLHDGLAVIAHGAVEVYAPRGQYQLIINRLSPDGVGPLELAFQQLREQLASEGLFDSDRKKPIVPIPRHIAVVTSPTGAAVRDMIQVLTRRWPACRVTVVPCLVQGERAAASIAAALEAADQINADTILCGRGGGSLEDLWAFNEEPVARAIAACRTPVISAVGHETDVTIADFVADRRALTPSEAAEFAVPDRDEMRVGLEGAGRRMVQSMSGQLRHARAIIDQVSQSRCFVKPLAGIHDRRRQVDDLSDDLIRTMNDGVKTHQRDLAECSARLDALSPLKTLARGYSLTTNIDGQLIRSVHDASIDQKLLTRLADGTVEHSVTAVRPTENFGD